MLADADELARVFQNLVVNAVKYRSQSRRGSTSPRAATSARGRCRSPTTASGIAPADAARVFEIFARGVGDDVPGSGVGLAVCQKIVERHGGLMWIEPRVARGNRRPLHAARRRRAR